MELINKKSHYVLYFLGACVLLLGTTVRADVISIQSVSTTKNTSFARTYPNGVCGGLGSSSTAVETMLLGTGLSGIPSLLNLSISEDAGSAVTTSNTKACLFEMSSNATSSVTGNYMQFAYSLAANSPQTTLSQSTIAYSGSWNSSTSLDPTKYYGITWFSGASQVGRLWGLSSGPSGYTCYPGSSGSCDGAPFFQLFSTPSLSSEGIRSIITPTYASVTSSANNVPFSFTYFINSLTYQYAGYYLTDLASGQSVNTSSQLYTISVSGLATFTGYSDLISGHQYQWQPYLIPYASSSPYLLGTQTFFFAVSNQSVYVPPAPSNPFATSSLFSFIPSATSTTGTTTNATTGLIPDSLDRLLRRKFPFSYVYDFGTVLSEFGTNGGAVADLTYSFPSGVGSSTNPIILLHNAQVQALSPVIAIKGVERYVMYGMYAFYVLPIILNIL